MKQTSHIQLKLPKTDNLHSISFLGQCLIILLKIFYKRATDRCGTFLVNFYGQNQRKRDYGKSLFKMFWNPTIETRNLQRTIKHGLIFYMALAMLAMPSGLCSQQHLLPTFDRPILNLPERANWQEIQNHVAHLAFSGFEASLKLDDTFLAEAVIEEEPADEKDSLPYHDQIMAAAAAYEVDPTLIRAIILAESSYNPQAVSKRGAQGLMQLMPTTARSLGVMDSFDPAMNIDGGVRYFKLLLDRFKGDVRLALAAYNAGSRYVRKYGGVPPFRATRIYIKKVLYYQKMFQNEMAVNESTEPAA